MHKLIVVFILAVSLPVQSLEVVFINPSETNNPFWQQVNKVAISAAKDLNINFKIIHGKGHRLLQKEVISELITSKPPPDFVIFLPFDGSAFSSFTKLEQAKIPFITIERTVFPDMQNRLAYPQENFKYWLGEIYHDNYKAGKLLAEALFKASHDKNMATKKKNVIGISGDMSGHSSERNAGLIEALENDAEHSLAQIVNARWQRQIAANMFDGLKERYHNINIVWTAADIMALGVVDVINNAGPITPNKVNQNIFSGGFDWTTEALIAIQNDNYTASVGGHFMQVAWALVKIYDYSRGKEVFFAGNRSPSYLLQLIDKNNINQYQVLLNKPNWDKIDFRHFSLFHQKELQQYQFDFSKVILMLNQ